MARIFVAPTDDADTVRAMGRFAIAAYLNVPVYAAFHEWLGRGEARRHVAAVEGGRPQGRARRHPRRGRRRADRVGPPEECREHIQRYVDNGVTKVLALASPGGQAAQAPQGRGKHAG